MPPRSTDWPIKPRLTANMSLNAAESVAGDCSDRGLCGGVINFLAARALFGSQFISLLHLFDIECYYERIVTNLVVTFPCLSWNAIRYFISYRRYSAYLLLFGSGYGAGFKVRQFFSRLLFAFFSQALVGPLVLFLVFSPTFKRGKER